MKKALRHSRLIGHCRYDIRISKLQTYATQMRRTQAIRDQCRDDKNVDVNEETVRKIILKKKVEFCAIDCVGFFHSLTPHDFTF